MKFDPLCNFLNGISKNCKKHIDRRDEQGRENLSKTALKGCVGVFANYISKA